MLALTFTQKGYSLVLHNQGYHHRCPEVRVSPPEHWQNMPSLEEASGFLLLTPGCSSGVSAIAMFLHTVEFQEAPLPLQIIPLLFCPRGMQWLPAVAHLWVLRTMLAPLQ